MSKAPYTDWQPKYHNKETKYKDFQPDWIRTPTVPAPIILLDPIDTTQMKYSNETIVIAKGNGLTFFIRK